MKITFLLGFYPNQRMNKRMRLLMQENDISIVFWKKNKDTNAYGTDIATKNYICIDAEFNEKSLRERYTALRQFKKKATQALCKIRPDCIYVQNLDLFLFAERYKRKHNIRLVYEVSDINDILIQPQKNIVKKTVQKYLRSAEERACKNVDLFCYTSPAFWKERYSSIIDESKQLFLPNIPDLSYFNRYTSHPWEDFTIGYVGTVRYEEQLRLMLEAAKKAHIKAVVAGGVASGGSRGRKVDIDKLRIDYPDAQIIGSFDYPSQIADIYGLINVSFAVYDTNLRNVKIALPNKLYEAIKCTIPIIVAPNTFLAETVQELGIGIATNKIDDIVEFLKQISSNKEMYMKYINSCLNSQDFINAETVNEQFRAWFRETQ